MKIPIIIYYHAKLKIKISNFSVNNEKEDDEKEYFFINTRNNNVFHLNNYNNSFLIKYNDVSKELQERIINKSYDSFQQYLATVLRK